MLFPSRIDPGELRPATRPALAEAGQFMKANQSMKKPKQAAATAAPSYIDAEPVSEDTLNKIRDHMRTARDHEARIRDLESVLSEEKKALNTMKTVTLPEVFAQAGVDNLGLPAEGNQPPYDFKLRSFTHASIGADWDDERRAEAFKVLEANGGKDLIKTEFVIFIPRELRAMVKKIQAALKPFKGIEVDKNESVAWNTLTAFVKEATEKRGLILPLEKLGATQGMIVDMKERKDGTSQKEGSRASGNQSQALASPEGTGRKRR
jgi:hypothetical protein